MKAWIVTRPDEEESVIVFAERRGQARSIGQSDLGSADEYMDYVVHRAPQYDKFSEQGWVPLADRLKDGWWCYCMGDTCCKRLDQNDIEAGRAVIIGDDAYCIEHVPAGGTRS